MSWFSDLFGGGDDDLTNWDSPNNPPTYDFKDEPGAYDVFYDDYQDGTLEGDYSSFMPSYSPTTREPEGKEWYDSFLSPSVIGAAITSGARLLKGMSDMDLQKEALKRQAEEKRMNDLIKLAQLKHQLIGRGSAGGGRRSGGSGANPAQSINTQASAALAGGYQNLGNNLASIYRG